jgi:hypothetical protein
MAEHDGEWGPQDPVRHRVIAVTDAARNDADGELLLLRIIDADVLDPHRLALLPENRGLHGSFVPDWG